ncbi:hypothetical protein GRJ2_002102200 [Grus japonensis]|uniref:Uncharacterized protein n=1 Tax=Grus japonensis TaxID=30415 RepID=A0ABC9XFM4_GRUJA
MKMIKGLENLANEERLKEFSLFFPEKSKLRRDLITVFQYLTGIYREDRGSVFTKKHMEKTRSNRYKLHQERFHLDIRKNFFYSKNNQSLEQQSMDMVEFPSLEVFKT